MPGLKSRARTVKELAENAAFYVRPRPIVPDDKALKLLSPSARERLGRLASILAAVEPWTEPAIEAAVRGFIEAEGAKLGDVAQPLRAALAGATTSPGIFDVAAVLGRDETLGRVRDAAGS
jgi:glutamyl-tRNA synthetase